MKLSVAVFAALCFFPMGVSAESPIRIGYSLALTGKGAFVGAQSRAGAELAAREARKNGIPVELLIEDHQSDPKVAVSSARKLLEVDKVDALLCDLTPTCVAASPVVRSAQRLFFYQSSAVSIMSDNPFAVRVFLDYEEGCREIAKRWRRAGLKKIGHLKWNSEAGEQCRKGSAEVFPDQVIFPYNSGEDLRSQVLAFKAKGVEGIFQTGYEDDYVARFRASAALQFEVPEAMPAPLLTKTVLQSVGVLPEGSMIFGFEEMNQGFVSRLRTENLYVSDVGIESAAIGYLETSAAIAAARKCGRNDITCSIRTIQELPESSVALPVRGWQSRTAEFKLSLKIVQAGSLVHVE